jgi:hypothetical protein
MITHTMNEVRAAHAAHTADPERVRQAENTLKLTSRVLERHTAEQMRPDAEPGATFDLTDPATYQAFISAPEPDWDLIELGVCLEYAVQMARSDLLFALYGTNAQVLTVDADGRRHY